MTKNEQGRPSGGLGVGGEKNAFQYCIHQRGIWRDDLWRRSAAMNYVMQLLPAILFVVFDVLQAGLIMGAASRHSGIRRNYLLSQQLMHMQAARMPNTTFNANCLLFCEKHLRNSSL